MDHLFIPIHPRIRDAMREKAKRKMTKRWEAATDACPRRRERVGTTTKAAGFLSKRPFLRGEGNGNSI